MGNSDAGRLPVVSLGAEHLAIGQLMRRNILAYKAPPNNEGYDLICIHPDPRKVTPQIRIQVKSRYQTDCDRALPVKERTFGAFDYLLVVLVVSNIIAEQLSQAFEQSSTLALGDSQPRQLLTLAVGRVHECAWGSDAATRCSDAPTILDAVCRPHD
jgi:hypothetical protein